MAKISKSRALHGEQLEAFARRFGCRLIFSNNPQTGVLSIGVIRPDKSCATFAVRRYSRKITQQIKEFMLPY